MHYMCLLNAKGVAHRRERGLAPGVPAALLEKIRWMHSRYLVKVTRRHERHLTGRVPAPCRFHRHGIPEVPLGKPLQLTQLLPRWLSINAGGRSYVCACLRSCLRSRFRALAPNLRLCWASPSSSAKDSNCEHGPSLPRQRATPLRRRQYWHRARAALTASASASALGSSTASPAHPGPVMRHSPANDRDDHTARLRLPTATSARA